MDNYTPNFIYNDGTFQIIEEEPVKSEKYYAVHENYKLIASFKDLKESLLYVGWRNTRAIKEAKESLKSSLSTNGDLNEPKGVLKDVS